MVLYATIISQCQHFPLLVGEAHRLFLLCPIPYLDYIFPGVTALTASGANNLRAIIFMFKN